MTLLGVHAEVEDLLEVLQAPSQDRAQQPRSSSSSPVCWSSLHPAWTRRLLLHRGPVRRPSSAEQPFGGFRVPVSRQGHFAADASVTSSVRRGSGRLHGGPMTPRRRFGSEGLGIPSRLPGCHFWRSGSVSCCCLKSIWIWITIAAKR